MRRRHEKVIMKRNANDISKLGEQNTLYQYQLCTPRSSTVTCVYRSHSILIREIHEIHPPVGVDGHCWQFLWSLAYLPLVSKRRCWHNCVCYTTQSKQGQLFSVANPCCVTSKREIYISCTRWNFLNRWWKRIQVVRRESREYGRDV